VALVLLHFLLRTEGEVYAQTFADSFQKNQTTLSRDTPGSASSVVSDTMSGGERDLRLVLTSGTSLSAGVELGTLKFSQASGVVGSVEVVWDGQDNDAETVDYSGLGGVNLTAGGQDAFLIGVNAQDQEAGLTLTVFSSSTHSSSVTVTLPPGLELPNVVSVPYNTFAGSADFTSVGAIRLVATAPSAVSLGLDFIRTTITGSASPVEATLTDVVLVDQDGDGKASAGDRLRYVMRIRNNSGGDLQNVQVNVPAIAHSTMVSGSLGLSPVARDDGPASASAPGDPFHGAFSTTLNLKAAEGLLANDLVGKPAGVVTHFGAGSLGGEITHAAGTTATVAAGLLTVNADGSLIFIPSSTFTGILDFQYRLANGQDSDTASVQLAVGVRPAAVADAHAVTGNVRIDTAQAPAFSILENDAGSHLAITTFQNPSAQGGTVSVSANGEFSYNPPVGYTGSDTFTYTIANGFGPSVGTVTLTVADRVWFVDNTRGAGDGRLSAPFNSLAAFVAVNNGAAGNPQAGDSVFFYTGSGNYTATTAAGLALLANQKVIGQGANVADLGTATGISFAAHSDGLPVLNRTDPVIANSISSGNGITLASGNTLRGLTIGTTPHGFGILGANAGTLKISECSKSGTGGALQLTGTTTADVVFDNLSSSSAPNQAVYLSGVAGSVQALAGSIDAPVGSAVSLQGGNGSFTYPGPITKNNSGRLVDIQNRTGGSVTLSGNLSHTAAGGTGIYLANNTGGTATFSGASKTLSTSANQAVTLTSNNGATIVFSNGGLVINTTSGTGFGASGGATALVVSGANNTISSGTGRAMNILNTTLGSDGLTFRSISSSGAINGIVLNNTGSLGGLAVTGSGAAGSGGTIQNSTGAGVVLASCAKISLTYLNIQNNADEGIDGQSVRDLTLTGCGLLNNGNSVSDEGVELRNLWGTCGIVNTTVSGSAHNNLVVDNTSGTLTALAISGSTFSTPSGVNAANNVLFQARQNAVVASVTLSSSTFSGAYASGLMVNASDVAVISDFTVQNSVFTDNGGAIDLTQSQSAQHSFKILNNATINGSEGHAINVFSSATTTGGSLRGRIQGNTIGNSAIVNSGSELGNGIRVLVQAVTDAAFLIDGNTIRQTPLGRGIEITSGSQAGVDATITSNDVNPQDTMGFPLAAIFLTSDNTTGSHLGLLRADVRNNTVPSGYTLDYPSFDQGPACTYLRMEELSSSTAQLVDTSPVSADATAQLTSVNTGSASANTGVALIFGSIDVP